MLGIFSSEPFYTTYIKLLDADTPPLRRIHSNPKLWFFFQHPLSALDGSDIVCAPPSHSHLPYRNQKGFMSQNCLFVCNFNLQFIFSYTGWGGGSATDAQVFDAGLKAVICLGRNKDLWSQRSKYKSYGALRGCDLGVRDCLQVYCGK